MLKINTNIDLLLIVIQTINLIYNIISQYKELPKSNDPIYEKKMVSSEHYFFFNSVG